MADSNYLYTGSSLQSGTNAGLSTQILIKVEGKTVGAIQSLTPSSNRPLKSITEIGTDGLLEIAPNGATTNTISVTRMVWQRKGLTDAFQRAYMNIHSQRVPFDIFVYDFTNAQGASAENGFSSLDSAEGVITTVYQDCWFRRLQTTYNSDNYLISQQAELDVTAVKSFANGNTDTSAVPTTAENSLDPLERIADMGRRGSMDARGLTQIAGLFD